MSTVVETYEIHEWLDDLTERLSTGQKIVNNGEIRGCPGGQRFVGTIYLFADGRQIIIPKRKKEMKP